MKTVFMFSGQGSHYYHMGCKLFEAEPIFRKHMHELDEIVRSEQGVSVVDELYNAKRRLFDPFWSLKLTHPAIFMTEYSLFKTLQAQGIVPDYVLGSSLGEVAAATIAGVLNEADALKLILQQARIIENKCNVGRMIAVLHDMDVYHRNAEINSNSTIAAVNAPSQFVISGEAKQLDVVKKFMQENEIIHQELMVSYGFHSSAIDAAEDDYLLYLNKQVFRQPSIDFISGITATHLHTLPGNYFWQITRKTALFSSAITKLENTIASTEELMYIDLGPAGSLANSIKYNLKESSRSKAFQVMSPFHQEMKKLEEIRKHRKENRKTIIATGSVKKERLLACIFPGQGSQKKGMGIGLFEKFPALTNQASEILGYSVKELCLQDPRRELNTTEFTQPALFVVNALSYLKWQEEEGVEPDFVAGHSLGEFNALFAAGAMDFATGVKLVQKRGALMAKMKEGGMAAVKGLSAEEIGHVIERNGLHRIDLANFNTHNQIVLSGPRELIVQSGHFFNEAGATMYFPLNVSGAFHSRYMLPAKEEFQQFLLDIDFSQIKIPVVSNVEASFYKDDNTKSLLASQLVSPVRWVESITFLLKQGEVTFREVGPGDVLTKMVMSIEKGYKEIVQ